MFLKLVRIVKVQNYKVHIRWLKRVISNPKKDVLEHSVLMKPNPESLQTTFLDAESCQLNGSSEAFLGGDHSSSCTSKESIDAAFLAFLVRFSFF